MTTFAWLLLVSPIILGLYSYVGYPWLLRILPRVPVARGGADRDLPFVSISLPVYNEEAQIRDVLDSLLRLDYPADRRQILVISDASTDGTDEIVRSYADQGIELLRQPVRLGKTAGEAAGAARLRGDIIVNTDASIRIAPDALKRIVAPFTDPSVGVVSGRDVSVARQRTANVVEGGYVDYEMRVRSLETRTGGIIGASGCFYAIRAQLHRDPLPPPLSRDFAAALIAEEHRTRAISADDAICYVPRTASPRREYKRKVRTIMRGMDTLFFKRHLLNPFKHGQFAWKLFSHKVCRWLLPWSAVFAYIGAAIIATNYEVAIWLALATIVGGGLLWIAWVLADRITLPGVMTAPLHLVLANIAVIHASLKAVRGDQNPIWEPTRREQWRPRDTVRSSARRSAPDPS